MPPLRKIGTISADDVRSPEYSAEVVFGKTLYQMAPLAYRDLKELIRVLRECEKEITEAIASAETAQSAALSIASALVETGVLKAIIVGIFGVAEEDYENTTLQSLVTAAGEVLRLNFFAASEGSRNAWSQLLETLNQLGAKSAMVPPATKA